jgi:hypothetical protein
MAIRPYTVIPLNAGAAYRDAYMVRWDGLLNGDDGQPIDLGAYADRTIQVLGTPGVGGNLKVEGSLLPEPTLDADFATLTDPQGNLLDVTGAKIEAVSEATRWLRPHITAGDGSTNFSIILLAIRK